MALRPWSASEESYVLRNLARRNTAEMAAYLGRPEAHVRGLLRMCGIDKPYVRPAHVSVRVHRHGFASRLRNLIRRSR